MRTLAIVLVATLLSTASFAQCELYKGQVVNQVFDTCAHCELVRSMAPEPGWQCGAVTQQQVSLFSPMQRCKKAIGYVPRSECKLKMRIFYGWATLFLRPEEIDPVNMPDVEKTPMQKECAASAIGVRCRYFRRIDYV